MGETSRYETGVYAWAEQRAEALRRLSGRPGLPNELDLAHVAEEIEDVGAGGLRAVESCLRNVPTHLVLIRADPDCNALARWAGEIVAWHGDLADRITPALRHRISLDRPWMRALDQAGRKLDARSREAGPARVAAIRVRWQEGGRPFTLESLCSAAFRVRDAVARIDPA